MSRYYSTSPRSGLTGIVVIAFVVLFALALGFGIYSSFHVEDHAGCHVTDKDRTTNRDGQSDMRIYTDNCGVFQVKDSILSRTWHSSDTYAGIKPGSTYDFETRGFRVPFLSTFPNIVKATEVN